MAADSPGHRGNGPSQAHGAQAGSSKRILGGIIFRMRSGGPWNRLPRELGDNSTIQRTFQRWVELGVLERIWAALVEECGELGA